MLPLGGRRTLHPTRIFFAGGMSPAMTANGLGSLGGNALSLMSTPYRRKLQNAEYDDTVEIIDATDSPAVIAACTDYEGTMPTLCETNSYENAVRFLL